MRKSLFLSLIVCLSALAAAASDEQWVPIRYPVWSGADCDLPGYGQLSVVSGRERSELVSGYFRADGTYVRGYFRALPRARGAVAVAKADRSRKQ